MASGRDSVHIDKQGDGFAITSIDILTEASVEGIDEGTFRKLAADTKSNSPVSKALSYTPMTLGAKPRE